MHCTLFGFIKLGESPIVDDNKLIGLLTNRDLWFEVIKKKSKWSKKCQGDPIAEKRRFPNLETSYNLELFPINLFSQT